MNREIDLSTSSFHEVRNYLLTKNFTFNQFILQLKKTEDQYTRQRAIINIATELDINPHFIEAYMKDQSINLKSFEYHQNYRFISNTLLIEMHLPEVEEFPREEGIFIKITSDLPESEALQLIRHAKATLQSYKKYQSPILKSNTRKGHGFKNEHIDWYIKFEQYIFEVILEQIQYMKMDKIKGYEKESYDRLMTHLTKEFDENDEEMYYKFIDNVKRSCERIKTRYNLPVLSDLNKTSQLINA